MQLKSTAFTSTRTHTHTHENDVSEHFAEWTQHTTPQVCQYVYTRKHVQILIRGAQTVSKTSHTVTVTHFKSQPEHTQLNMSCVRNTTSTRFVSSVSLKCQLSG